MPGSNKKDEYKEQNKQEQQNQQEETEVKLNTVKVSGDDLEDDPNDTEAERERKRKERQLRMEKQARDAAYWDEFTRQRVEKDEKITQIKIERFQRSVEETHEMLTHAGGLIQDSEPGNNPNQNAQKTYDYGLSDLEEQERKQKNKEKKNAVNKKKHATPTPVQTVTEPEPEPAKEEETPEKEEAPVLKEAKIEVKEKNFIHACKEMLSIPAKKADYNSDEYKKILSALDDVNEVLKKGYATATEAKNAYVKSIKKVLNNINRYRVHKAADGVDKNDVENEKIIAIECVDQYLRMRYKEFVKKDYEDEIGAGKQLFNVNVDSEKEGDDYILDKGLSKIDNMKKEIDHLRAHKGGAKVEEEPEVGEEVPVEFIDEHPEEQFSEEERQTVHNFVDELFDLGEEGGQLQDGEEADAEEGKERVPEEVQGMVQNLLDQDEPENENDALENPEIPRAVTTFVDGLFDNAKEELDAENALLPDDEDNEAEPEEEIAKGEEEPEEEIVKGEEEPEEEIVKGEEEPEEEIVKGEEVKTENLQVENPEGKQGDEPEEIQEDEIENLNIGALQGEEKQGEEKQGEEKQEEAMPGEPLYGDYNGLEDEDEEGLAPSDLFRRTLARKLTIQIKERQEREKLEKERQEQREQLKKNKKGAENKHELKRPGKGNL